MAFDPHKNFAITNVTIAPTPATSGTSLTVQDATVFPATPFNATVWPLDQNAISTNSEIVRVTNIASNVLTITRTQESTSARSIIASDRIAAAITAKNVTDLEAVLNGTVALPNGQLQFPATQVPSAGANVLDDYEELTWTPVIGGSGGTSGQTYTTQTGVYIKIGKLVWVGYQALLSNKGTITGNVQLQGLPFTVENTGGSFGTSPLDFVSLATNWIGLYMRAQAGTTTALILGQTAAATNNESQLATADITNTTQFIGSLIYRASA